MMVECIDQFTTPNNEESIDERLFFFQVKVYIIGYLLNVMKILIQ